MINKMTLDVRRWIKSEVFAKTLLLVAIFACLQSCTAVKPYQKSKINDSEMDLASRKAEKFEQSFYLYREGASGANGGKSGGGCGCN
jgi:Domain of unknown function (DUF4266)